MTIPGVDRPGRTAGLALRIGWTEGQLQTALLGSGLAVLLTVFGLGPALGERSPATSPLAQPAGDPPPAAELGAPPDAAVPAPSAVLPDPPLPAIPTGPDLSPPQAAQPVSPPFDAPPLRAPSPAEPAPVAPAPAEAGPPSAATDGLLTIASSGWYTDDAGTPLTGTVDPVPDGGLPVAARGARTSRLSVLRLAGDPGAIRLTLPLANGGQRFEDRAGLQLCPVLDPGWKPEPAQPLADAPVVDRGNCVEGERGDARWSFDLTAFVARVGGAGFALLPVSDPQRPLFQVTFAGTASAAATSPVLSGAVE